MSDTGSAPEAEICSALDRLCEETDRYINLLAAFPVSFSFGEADRKKYSEAYYAMSVRIADILSACDSLIVEINGKMLAADRAGNAEATAYLNEFFKFYLSFQDGVSNFIRENESIVKDRNSISRSACLIPAHRLKSSAESTLKSIRLLLESNI